jgi:hypothetical protein
MDIHTSGRMDARNRNTRCAKADKVRKCQRKATFIVGLAVFGKDTRFKRPRN